MKKIYFVALIALFAGFSSCKKEAYKDKSLTPEERAEDLLNKLSLEEKAMLVKNSSEAIPQFGIRKYDWWNEALHGVARNGIAYSEDNSGVIFYNNSILDCLLTNSLYDRNVGHAVSILFGENITIYGNVFILNDYYGGLMRQCLDDGINCTWYNNATQTGNFWIDWSGAGAYTIFGQTISQDLYPQETSGDSFKDSDGDQMHQISEKAYRTFEDHFDSDKDGYNDGLEIMSNTNPLDPNHFPIGVSEFLFRNLAIVFFSLFALIPAFVYGQRRK